MTARMPYPYTLDAAHQWIDGLEDGERVFSILHADELIGVTGYTLAADRRTAEVGYWIGKPYWGRGFATEAARAVIDFCFRKEGVSAVTCGHFIDNPASARVIGKLGFEPDGSSMWWCQARRMEETALRYRLPRPSGWLRLAVPLRLKRAG